MTTATLELLCVEGGGQVYALDIMVIREILRNQAVTPVPRAPAPVAGVTNLRGELIPVIDLHQAVTGAPARGETADPKLVVVRAAGRVTALRVEQVIEVVSVPLGEMKPVPGTAGRAGPLVAAFRREGAGVVLVVLVGALLAEGERTGVGGGA